jgi:hypothetical protein
VVNHGHALQEIRGKLSEARANFAAVAETLHGSTSFE